MIQIQNSQPIVLLFDSFEFIGSITSSFGRAKIMVLHNITNIPYLKYLIKNEFVQIHLFIVREIIKDWFLYVEIQCYWEIVNSIYFPHSSKIEECKSHKQVKSMPN